MVIVVAVTAFVWVAVVFSSMSDIFKCMLCDEDGCGGCGSSGGGDGGDVGGGCGVGGGQEKSHHNQY